MRNTLRININNFIFGVYLSEICPIQIIVILKNGINNYLRVNGLCRFAMSTLF